MKKMKHATIFLFLIIAQIGYTKSIVSDYSTFNVIVKGKGNPIILINGIGCSSDVWSETVNALSSKNECHVIQIKGFAGIAPAVDLDFNKFINEIIFYIKDKQL